TSALQRRCLCPCVLRSLLFFLCLLALSIGLGVGTKGASCAYAPIIIAALYFLYAVVLVVLRPHRLFSDVVLAPVSSALFGAMWVCKYVGSSTSVLETVLSVVQITQMLLRLLALFREWEWRELVPEPAEHADAARGNLNDMKEEEEMDDVSLGECEMEPPEHEHEDDVAFWDEDGAPIAPPSNEDEDLPPPPPPLMPLRATSDINNNEKASRKNKRFARTAKKRANLLLSTTQVTMQPIVVVARQRRSLNPPNNGLSLTTTMMRDEDDHDVGAMMTHDISLLLPEANCDGALPQTRTSLFFNET
ncbi:membrane-associated protein, putative, partial [Bodo saltans]